MSVQKVREQELFNEQVKKDIGNDALYFSALLDQWKTANDLTVNISAQRNSVNNFYMSLLSLLIGGILLSDKLMLEQLVAKTVMLILVMIVGIACCVNWVKQVEKCKRINYQKFMIIAELEKHLPANVLSYESSIALPSEKKNKKASGNLSDYEKRLAFIFGITIASITITMLIEMWCG